MKSSKTESLLSDKTQSTTCSLGPTGASLFFESSESLGLCPAWLFCLPTNGIQLGFGALGCPTCVLSLPTNMEAREAHRPLLEKGLSCWKEAKCALAHVAGRVPLGLVR